MSYGCVSPTLGRFQRIPPPHMGPHHIPPHMGPHHMPPHFAKHPPPPHMNPNMNMPPHMPPPHFARPPPHREEPMYDLPSPKHRSSKSKSDLVGVVDFQFKDFSEKWEEIRNGVAEYVCAFELGQLKFSVQLQESMGDSAAGTFDLSLYNDNEEDLNLIFKIMVIDKAREGFYCHTSEVEELFESGGCWGNEFWHSSALIRYLANNKDVLHLRAQVTIFNHPHYLPATERLPITRDLNRKNVQKCFGELLNSGTLSDVTFVVDGKDVPAHKFILVAQSSVFRQMFIDGSDSQKSRIIVEDTSLHSFKLMLSFLYKGDLDERELTPYATEVLALADRYDIYHLREMCCVLMTSLMTAESCSEILSVAWKYKATYAIKRATLFVADHFNAVTGTKSFTEHVLDKAELVHSVHKAYRDRMKVPVIGDLRKAKGKPGTPSE